jgi:hypothetical protein
MSQLPVDAALERGYSPALQRGFASNFNPPAAEHNPTQSRTEDSEDRRTVEESSSQIVVRSEFSNTVSLNYLLIYSDRIQPELQRRERIDSQRDPLLDLSRSGYSQLNMPRPHLQEFLAIPQNSIPPPAP